MTPTFRVFVSGQNLRARRILNGVREASVAAFGVQPEIELIDVLERPDLADADQVLATPLLIRLDPPPPRRLIGDLANAEQLLAVFERDLGPAGGVIS